MRHSAVNEHRVLWGVILATFDYPRERHGQ